MKTFVTVCSLALIIQFAVSIPYSECPAAKETTERDAKDLFCQYDEVLRGKPPTNTDFTLPGDNKRSDVFTVNQYFKSKAQLTKINNPTVTVEYVHTPSSNCPQYPYDQDGLEVVIFGKMKDGKIQILGCDQAIVYDCIENRSAFNGYTKDDCVSGDEFNFGF